jgi:hypothetical protein
LLEAAGSYRKQAASIVSSEVLRGGGYAVSSDAGKVLIAKAEAMEEAIQLVFEHHAYYDAPNPKKVAR